MKLKELSKLPKITAPKSFVEKAGKDTPRMIKKYGATQYRYETREYAKCRMYGDIIKVALFYTKNLRLGATMPAYEIFIDYKNEDFITYDYSANRWSNATIEKLDTSFYWWSEAKEKKYMSAKDRALLKINLKIEEDNSCGDYYGILKFQQRVRERQLLARHKKETDKWDEAMNKVTQVPKDWDKFIAKSVIKDQYIFYEYSRKSEKDGYCTWCENDVKVKNPKHNAQGRCPHCGHKITYKASGKSGSFYTGNFAAYLIQPYGDDFIIRLFEARCRYEKHKMGGIRRIADAYSYERCRYIYDSDNSATGYSYELYKQREVRWCCFGRVNPDYYNSSFGTVYKRNLSGKIAERLSRTGLIEYIKGNDECDPRVFITKLKRSPEIEKLAKVGLPRLINDCMYEYRYDESCEFSDGKLAKMLLIDNFRTKRLIANNGGLVYLEWLRNEKTKDTVYDDRTIQWLVAQHIRPDMLDFISDRMSVQQIKNYICRQMSENSMTSRGVIQTWSDYLSMAERLKMNTSDPIVYRAKKLRLRHDELVKEVDDKERALRAAEISKKYPNIETVLQKIKPKYEYEDETYSILIPGKIEDILTEGAALHHCIDKTDRYFDRINVQESYLMFLRRTAEKDKPYYTLEVEPNGTVRQKRTEFDRQNPDIEDAKTFLRKWQKIISKRLSSEDMKLASKSKKLRNEEFEELERTKAQIRNGALQGHLLVTVLREDLMENTDESEKVSV